MKLRRPLGRSDDNGSDLDARVSATDFDGQSKACAVGDGRDETSSLVPGRPQDTGGCDRNAVGGLGEARVLCPHGGARRCHLAGGRRLTAPAPTHDPISDRGVCRKNSRTMLSDSPSSHTMRRSHSRTRSGPLHCRQPRLPDVQKPVGLQIDSERQRRWPAGRAVLATRRKTRFEVCAVPSNSGFDTSCDDS